jgi:hypothetical protein
MRQRVAICSVIEQMRKESDTNLRFHVMDKRLWPPAFGDNGCRFDSY